MAGLYIHVPFCAKRCIYCDFFSQTKMKYKDEYVRAIIQELEIRKQYIGEDVIETIYFGGGTPSQLQASDFETIFNAINRLYDTSVCQEITLEANPDDLSLTYIESLRSLPFNRISMGVQSFKNEDLHFLNRRHTASQAIQAIADCRKSGYTNLSIDLIYGLPGQTLAAWNENLSTAISLDIPHLSAYHLIYEQGTALYKLKEAGKISPTNEETSVDMFSLLIDRLTDNGYIHYEISNFGKSGMFSRHNSAYWTGEQYLGLGPSAHSYNGENRQWNVSSLTAYLKGIGNGTPDTEIESLDLPTRYNDYIITGLRTMWGINLEKIQSAFGSELVAYCREQAHPHLLDGTLKEKDSVYTLSRKGIFISDGIMSDLLFV